VIKFIIALQFLTRIQISPNLVVDERTFGKSMIYFPVVGLLIGIILAGTHYLLSFLFTPLITAVFLVWLEVAISGGLHLDGYMDTMDGIYSGRSRERILEIMRDSRVGAHSVIALACLFIFKLAFLADYPADLLTPVLILMPMLSRLTQLIGVTCFPYVRETGLAKNFNDYLSKKDLGLAGLISLIICLLVGGWLGLIFFAVTFLIAFTLGKYITGKVGGLTGDVYGAITELSEVLLLVVGYLISLMLSYT